MGARVRAVSSFVLLALAGAPAAADRPDAPVRLRYRAPGGCPDRAAFARQLLARAPGLREPRPGERAQVLSVEIVVAPGGFVGALSVRERDGRAARRRVTDPDCAQVVAAL